MNLAELKSKYQVPGVVEIVAGSGGLPRVDITAGGASAQVYLHGAHVAGYRPAGQDELLFMSGKSSFEEGKPIRGGVPICFPWFGPKEGDPSAPMHGFARLRSWELQGVHRGNDSVTAVLGLKSDEETKKLWPYDFTANYSVTVGEKGLTLELAVSNTGNETFTFAEALHTYFSVGDVRQVSVEGLAGVTYIDKTDGGKRKQEAAEPIRITAETDRLYLNTTAATVLNDPSKGRKVTVGKEGSASTVVWNPWIAKAKAMPDFGDEEWVGMICIETVNAADNVVRVGPGEQHVIRAVIRSEKAQA
jgi:glucose-6-phosphate 1-epimerase